MFFASVCVIGSYLYITAGILMIWGIYLFGYKMIYKRRIRLLRNRKLIYLFLGCAVFTSLLHIKSNFFINLYYILWMALCFFFFYGIHSGRSRNSCKREAFRILGFIVASTTVMMLAGMVLLAFFPQGFELFGCSFAIHENRFVGIINNANVTAFYANTAFIGSNLLWAIRKSDKTLDTKHKIYYILTAAVNLLALFLSDSNDSLLMLIVYVCFIFFYVIFKGFRPGIANLLFRVTALILACVVSAAVLLSARTLVQTGITHLLSLSEPAAQISTGVTAEDGQVHIKPDTERDDETTFKHQNKNIDSGRFVIWKQAVCLFEKFPVFGIGKANVVDYGEIYLGGLKYYDFHNGLITITISYGLVGLNLFMIFAITAAKTMLKALFRYRKENRRDGRVLTIITAFCAAYCVYSMFEISLLADLSYKVLIFWLLIGLGTSYALSYERSAIHAHENIPKRSRSICRIAKYRANTNFLPAEKPCK